MVSSLAVLSKETDGEMGPSNRGVRPGRLGKAHAPASCGERWVQPSKLGIRRTRWVSTARSCTCGAILEALLSTHRRSHITRDENPQCHARSAPALGDWGFMART
jgi:hypothetical protein